MVGKHIAASYRSSCMHKGSVTLPCSLLVKKKIDCVYMLAKVTPSFCMQETVHTQLSVLPACHMIDQSLNSHQAYGISSPACAALLPPASDINSVPATPEQEGLRQAYYG